MLGNHLAATHGEALNTVQRFRQLAEYTSEPVSLGDAQWSVTKAQTFVEIIHIKLVTSN